MNVTYEYYKESFGGSLIPENRWISLELKMSARLNQYTFDRMKEDNWPEQAKTALCEMCDCAYKYNRIRSSSDCLGKLTAFIVSNISRRRSDQT